jgi:Peroxiredoxin
MSVQAPVKVGDVAPDFTRTTQNGKTFHLKDFQGKQAVVLYFYPKDETSVCTAEACSFRDRYEDFKAAGAEVIGVSSDTDESHRAFAGHHHLPFELVSDSDNSLRELYGVKPEDTKFGLLPGRVTYVIDKAGVVQLVFSSVLESEPHIAKALQLLQQQ